MFQIKRAGGKVVVMTLFVFWFCGAGLFYIYLGYPALIWLLARVSPQPVRRGAFHGSVSVVIAAHNEAARLPAKIESLLRSEGTSRIAEILIGSDGSTDGTAALRFADPRVRVVGFTDRRGKPSVFNDLVPPCKGDIVVLTDARQEVDEGAIGRLLENFSDPAIGVVSGELVFRSAETAVAQGIGFYWNYEKFIRKQESRFRSVPGATGALYAIRRELFRPIPPDTLLDDVAIPMQAMSLGTRCVLEAGACVFDEPSAFPEEESIRKRRTIAGNAQLLQLYSGWLWPWENPLWFEFMSHKIARLFSPLLLAGVFVSSAWLISRPFFAAVFVMQLAFYLASGAGWILQREGIRARGLGVPLMFVSLNVTTFLALGDALRKRFSVTWDRSSAPVQS